MDGFQLMTGQIVSLKAYRVNAIILLGRGWTVVQVAEALLVDEKTIRIWHEKYVHGGEDELLTLFYVGKAPLLSDIQQQELAEHLDEHTYLDSKAVVHYIEKTYGIAYSRTGVKELLHRLDFVYKKPKPVPGKLDPAKQEAFLSEYAALRANKGENDPVSLRMRAIRKQHSGLRLDSSRHRQGIEVQRWSQTGEHQRRGGH